MRKLIAVILSAIVLVLAGCSAPEPGADRLSEAIGVFVAVISVVVGLIVIVIAILTLLAINNLHRIPQMQESMGNIERYLKYLATEKKRAADKDQSPPPQSAES